MIELATVTSADEEFCTVKLDRKAACDSCKMCAFPNNSRSIEFKVENTKNCKTGDLVEIEMSNKMLMLASILVYLLPLALGGILLYLSIFISKNEVIQTVITVLGVLVGFDISIRISKKFKNKFSLTIKKVINITEDIKND